MNKHQEQDLYAFLDRPAVSSVAVCTEADTFVVDEADTLLRTAYAWPTGYPDDKKSSATRIRFHYRRTNHEQAKSAFQSILAIYRAHHLSKNSTLTAKYPHLKDYLIADPLGLKEYPISDTVIYYNAAKLVSTNAKLAASSTTASATLPDITDPGTEGTDARKKKKKPKKTKGKPHRTSGEGDLPTIQELATSGTAETKTPDQLTKVKTHFAHQLAKIQKDLYVSLRSNIQRFMDTTCHEIIQNHIAQHEQTNSLKGFDRVEKCARACAD